MQPPQKPAANAEKTKIPFRIKLMFWRHVFTAPDKVRAEVRALSPADWELLDAYANRWRI